MKTRKYEVVLRDGTRFVGKRNLQCWWLDNFTQRWFIVASSNTLPVGVLICVPIASISYRYEIEG